MTEYGTIVDKRKLATAQSVSNLNGRVSNLSKTTDDVKDIAESALKVATIEYAIGTETEATGEWQALTPKPSAGEYVWQRVTVTTGAGKTTQTTSLIQNIAALAQSTADTAKEKADTATASAKAAQSTADTAVSNAATAQSTADTAKEKADTATASAKAAQSTADTAVTDAATAQSTAETAKADAATAQSTADTAKADAATAQSTANTAVSNAATAQTKANEAASAAATAQSKADSAGTAASKAQSSANAAGEAAAAAQSTANTAVSNAATAQSAADDAKTNAATAQTGVDTLNTYIRSRDDGVEVARKDAAGNYVGYKTIQTADGLEVRTADDVLIAKYGDNIQLTNGTAEGFRVEFGNTLVPIKENFSDISNINEDEDNITISDDGRTWAKSYTTKWGADQATGVKASGHIYASYASAGNSKEATMNFDLADGESKAVKFNDGVQAAKATVAVAYTSTGNATVTLSIDPGADIITLSNFSIAYRSPREDVCMGTLGTHPDTSTPAVFRVGNGTEEEPSNAFAVDWDGNVTAKGNITAGGSIAMNGTNISKIFSGVISVGYEDKRLNIAAGGNTGESTINLLKDGYSARCICGWNLSSTGSSNCVIPKLFINQTEQKIHYYVKNTGSSKATPTLRTYVLYTKNN